MISPLVAFILIPQKVLASWVNPSSAQKVISPSEHHSRAAGSTMRTLLCAFMFLVHNLSHFSGFGAHNQDGGQSTNKCDLTCEWGGMGVRHSQIWLLSLVIAWARAPFKGSVTAPAMLILCCSASCTLSLLIKKDGMYSLPAYCGMCLARMPLVKLR